MSEVDSAATNGNDVIDVNHVNGVNASVSEGGRPKRTASIKKPVTPEPKKVPKKRKEKKVDGEPGEVKEKKPRVRKEKKGKKKKSAKIANVETSAGDGAIPSTGTEDEPVSTSDGEVPKVDGEAAKVDEAKKSKKKPLKKSIPMWANIADKSKILKQAMASSDSVGIIVSAIESSSDEKGLTSYVHLKKFIAKNYPHWPKMTMKGALKRALAKGKIKQIKGSFKVTPNGEKPVATAKKGTVASKAVQKYKDQLSRNRNELLKDLAGPKSPLDDLLPHIFTWVCNPKEASYILIKKYIAKNFPHLDVESVHFKHALESGVKKGQLEKISGGSGLSGTFQLVDNVEKSGTKFEDAIEDAIIASNEPKDASFTALRNYIYNFHKEYNVGERPKILMNALERCMERGWIIRISGKGMSGSFRLAYPYCPAPRELWGKEYKESDYAAPKKDKSTSGSSKKSNKRVDLSSESEDSSSESESDEESDAEVIPAKKNRGGAKPTLSRPAPVQKKPAAKKVVAKKSQTAKKRPAKKPAAKTPVFAKKSAPKRSESFSDDGSDIVEVEYVPAKKVRGVPTPRAIGTSKAKKDVAKKASAKKGKK